MAELTPKERLQPSLLDRLIDDEPQKQVEAREKRVLSVRQLRESVKRDLAWLLNTTNYESGQSLEGFPEVKSSVLNFGIPELAGHLASDADVVAMETELREAVARFEPRILQPTLNVKVVVSEREMSHNAMIFDIQGDLWAQPLPQHLYLKTEMDLETGDVAVMDYSG